MELILVALIAIVVAGMAAGGRPTPPPAAVPIIMLVEERPKRPSGWPLLVLFCGVVLVVVSMSG